jgi:hypothetical protein
MAVKGRRGGAGIGAVAGTALEFRLAQPISVDVLTEVAAAH